MGRHSRIEHKFYCLDSGCESFRQINNIEIQGRELSSCVGGDQYSMDCC